MAAAAARVVMAGIVTVANVWAAGGDTRAVHSGFSSVDITHPHVICFQSFNFVSLPSFLRHYQGPEYNCFRWF